MTTENLSQLSKLIRYYILVSSTTAGSGHPTSSLSAVELMTALFFNHLRFDLDNPENPENDRLIFSKGHATPLFYSLYAAAGKLTEKELRQYRSFDSSLEGHPSTRFKYTEVPTGSLGQGLSIGLGMALTAKLDDRGFNTFVLLGDGEMAEGQVWEALQLASHYGLDNLVAVIDVNRLGQTGETMYGHDLDEYDKKLQTFGWRTYKIADGHDIEKVNKAYDYVLKDAKTKSPTAIIAKTVKGKGVSFLEDKEDWHGKALNEKQLQIALSELGEVRKEPREVAKPDRVVEEKELTGESVGFTQIAKGEKLATRKAYGSGLVRIGSLYPEVVCLDAEVSNSTYSERFKHKYPERFFEMFIAEQNMVGTALGMASRGKVPYVSSFAAFFTRAFDQIRMAQYSGEHIVFAGSHAGVSIGEDGPSQMGLEDLAMFRSILGSTIFYPADAVATEAVLEEAYKTKGIVYIRTTRPDTPVVYEVGEEFPVGGSKILKESDKDVVTLVSAGSTLFHALEAAESLEGEGMMVRVLDLYSVKPIDKATLTKAAKETGKIITVEDHHTDGGIGDAVLAALSHTKVQVYKMAVTKTPRSGNADKLYEHEEIDSESIVNKVKTVLD